ncbi:MAG TPA: hypothetical protein VLM38_02135 [Blastocatellia bacterium]|nr:hypothetical protein [Blastocatellia bacterium]
MEMKYGQLMSLLLHNREHCASEAEFRTYLLESTRRLTQDLRDFGLEVVVRPLPAKTRDWNYLKIGCE